MYAPRKSGYRPFYENELHYISVGHTEPVEAAEYALKVFPKATVLAVWEVSVVNDLIRQVPPEEYAKAINRNGY